MAKPKLALIPSAQGDKFYSVLPSSGVGDFDFTRSGGATRINSQGLIETVADGVSRLNYPLIDGKVVGCPSHLLEPSRSNIMPYSEDFTQGAWIKLTNSTAVGNVAISPDGTQNSSEIKAVATSTSVLGIQDGFTVSSGISYTVSFFAKKGVARYIQLFHGGGQVTGNARTNFDLEDGVVTVSDAGHTSSIEDFGNGWFRCVVELNTLTTTLQTYFNAVKEPNASRSATSSWSANDNFYLWGAQLEAGSYPTSYIPSLTGSQTTRSAETANNSGNASTFNDSEGVLMAEISALADSGGNRRISISDGTNSNRLFLAYTSVSNELIAINVSDNTTSVLISTSISVLQSNKIVFKYKQNDFSLWVNGFKIGIDTSANTPIGLNTLRFEDGNGGNDFYGNTKQIQYFDSALTESDLEKLTSWVSFSDMAEGQLYTIE
jgi:hypothetical protein